jgi:hypothetical protein
MVLAEADITQADKRNATMIRDPANFLFINKTPFDA